MVTVNQIAYYCRKIYRLFKKVRREFKNQQHQGGSGEGGGHSSGHPTSGGYNGGSTSGAGGSGGGAGPWQDIEPSHNGDIVNSNDDNFQRMRNEAYQLQTQAQEKFSQSQQAYKSGDKAAAHQLSEEGKSLNRRRDQLNEQAADWIFTQNNKNRPPNEVDLHGLKVTEAEQYAKQSIARARNNGVPVLRLIVGKGNHSADHVAKIRPAIEQYLRENNLQAQLDPNNAGVVEVLLQGQNIQKGAKSIDQSGNEDCVIM